MITVYTQVYNTKPFLIQCIESVLTQTYSDFQYILVDNGCSDGSSEILKEYAQKDARIHLIKYEENQYGIMPEIVKRVADGRYLSVLDSDDWWEPDYLERMVKFMEENDLDLAITGTVQYLEAYHADKLLRKLDSPIILTQKQFADEYPRFWAFPSTVWASVQKMSIYKADFKEPAELAYGGDTMHMLEYIKRCTRIGIDSSALYHYRIHPKGMSYLYDPRRFDANIVYYEQIKKFLELHHTFDPPKQEWLKRVHLASMTATLGLLRDARITDDEKLTECARIIEHPLTAVALSNDCDERKQWFSVMWGIVFSVLTREEFYNQETLYKVLQTLSPKCCEVAWSENLGLFAKETVLCNALRKDDWEQMICRLMELIVLKRYSKQYNLGQILGNLIPAQTPLEGITDARFFRKYADICMLVLSENYPAALDQMTGLLLEEKKLYATEEFLKLYLSLSALGEEIPAFLFGKTRLAWFYFRHGRREECRALVDELTEMGLDSEELSELRRALEKKP